MSRRADFETGVSVNRKRPKVSLCIPAFQAERHLQTTIDSVLAQKYAGIEIVVVDNNSSDGTWDILETVKDDRIRIIRNASTLPMIDNFNFVIQQSRGEFVKLICADDIIEPDCIEAQVSLLESMPEVALTASRIDYIADDGQLLLSARGLGGMVGRLPAERVVKRIVHCGGNPIGPEVAAMFRRTDFDRCGGFQSDLWFVGDVDLWVRLLRCGDFFGLPRTLASFRVRSDSVTAMASVRAQRAQQIEFEKRVVGDPRWNMSVADCVYGRVRCYEAEMRRKLLFALGTWRISRRSRQPVASNTAKKRLDSSQASSGSGERVEEALSPSNRPEVPSRGEDVMNAAAVDLTIRPAMRSSGSVIWDGAVWVGEVWVDAVDSVDRIGRSRGLPVHCRLEESRGYSRARLLVRTDDRALGFVEVGVTDGRVEFAELRRRVADVQATSCHFSDVSAGEVDAKRPGRQQTPAVTVVVCTHDRLSTLRVTLESILALDYPDFETIVVDNAATTDASRKYVLGLDQPRVRVIDEPRPGASRARNAGLAAATGDIVAFTDDDVVVDRYWLRALVNGFARGTSVSCVSGMVPAGEIRTPAQAYFDQRVHWSDSTRPRVYDWTQPPRDVPLFPFAVRCFGTGANFAVERDAVFRLGGFDEALGPGSPTHGGEDIDMFFRILRAGRQLVHDPAAIVWHRHRADNEALAAQTLGYGLGLGAWLGKIACDCEVAMLAVRRAARHGPTLFRYVRASSNGSEPPANLSTLVPANVSSSTWGSIIQGTRAYRSALREGRSPEPLLAAGRRLPSETPTNRIGAL